MKEGNQRKSGVILSYISIIINTLIQLLYTPFLIKMLGQSEYGLYSLVSSIIGYLTVMDLGFGNAIIVYTAKYNAQGKYDEEKKLHGMFNRIFKLIGIIAFVLGLILYFNVNRIFENTMSDIEIKKMKIMMIILSFNLLLSFYFAIYSSIISAYEKFTFNKIMAIVQSVLKPLIMLPLLLVGFKSITLCLIITIINFIVLIANYLYCKKALNIKIKYQGFNLKIIKIIFGYSIWIFLGIIVDKVNWSVDNFVLGAVSGTVAISIYSIAAHINTMFINISTAVSGVFLPKMSKLVASQTDNITLTNEFIKIGRIQFYIVFLILSGFIIFGKLFIRIWVGDSFIESYYVTLCLICPAMFSLIQNLGLSIMQAMNKYKFKAISSFIMSIFNVIISVFLAKKYGAVGAAFGTTISLILCNTILINIYYYKVIKLDVIKFWKDIFKMLINYVLLGLFFYFGLNYIYVNDILKFISCGLIYIIIYGLVSYFIVMNEYEKGLLKPITKKLKRRKNV